MAPTIHLISNGIPGCGPPDRYLPCSGVSGRAINISPHSSHDVNKPISDMNFLSLKSAYRYTSPVCNAHSGKYRRNPDPSRQNRHGFSRNRNNRNNEEKEGYEDTEESEIYSSKNGSPLSLSGNPKFQTNTSPGPREKEIVELFRKVQAQLRERAAMKEERKVEDTQGKGKESETVDSLLKLLRKHSIQGKKNNTSRVSNKDFVLDQTERAPLIEEKRTNVPERPRPHLSRPKSNFRKRSPVPVTKSQPVYSEGSVNSISRYSLDVRRKGIDSEPESDSIHEAVEYDSESDVGPAFSGGNVSDNETSGRYDENVVEEENPVETSDLSSMKVTELRAVAKSRGMKGFSKLKKNELIELLSRNPM